MIEKSDGHEIIDFFYVMSQIIKTVPTRSEKIEFKLPIEILFILNGIFFPFFRQTDLHIESLTASFAVLLGHWGMKNNIIFN